MWSSHVKGWMTIVYKLKVMLEGNIQRWEIVVCREKEKQEDQY